MSASVEEMADEAIRDRGVLSCLEEMMLVEPVSVANRSDRNNAGGDRGRDRQRSVIESRSRHVVYLWAVGREWRWARSCRSARPLALCQSLS